MIKKLKLYIDTNVFVYASEDSKNIYGKDLSESASKIFFESSKCKFFIVISSWTLEELSRIKKVENLKFLFELIRKKIVTIQYSEEDLYNAKKLNSEHYHDALHFLLALKSKADYIVTRNVKDFEEYKSKIKVVKPEFILNQLI